MDKSRKEKIRARLAKIESKGRLTPDAVIEDASDPKSPLHPYFDWDDTVAARKWRISQARDLISSVRVEVTTDERVISTFSYVRDPSVNNEEQGYIHVATLKSDRLMAVEAVMSELRRAQSCFERCYTLADSLGLADVFSDLGHKLEAIKLKLVA